MHVLGQATLRSPKLSKGFEWAADGVPYANNTVALWIIEAAGQRVCVRVDAWSMDGDKSVILVVDKLSVLKLQTCSRGYLQRRYRDDNQLPENVSPSLTWR